MITRLRLATMAVGAVMAAAIGGFASPAHANNIPPNCQQQPWGFLGTQTRQICDGPILPDGSWMRTRVTGVPAHYENPSSDCYSGSYSSHCTYYPGGYVSEHDSDNETYPVRPDTVLPDEPGHLG